MNTQADTFVTRNQSSEKEGNYDKFISNVALWAQNRIYTFLTTLYALPLIRFFFPYFR